MTTVSIHIGTSDDDNAELDRLFRQLRGELLELAVDDVTFETGGEAPAGAKGDPLTVGMLVVSLANSAGLAGILQIARGWVNRDSGRRIVVREGKCTLEITGASPEQQQQIIDAFLANDHK